MTVFMALVAVFVAAWLLWELNRAPALQECQGCGDVVDVQSVERGGVLVDLCFKCRFEGWASESEGSDAA